MKNGNVNVVICPPCGESTAKSGVRGAYKATSLISPSIGPADHFLRKGGRKGFTLIELLVVVLIIGILAAVAVPQYQKAVDRADVARVLSFLHAVYQAQKVYYLENGSYASSQEKLSLAITCPQKWNCKISQSKAEAEHKGAPSISINMYYVDYIQNNINGEGKMFCVSSAQDPRGLALCKFMGPLFTDGAYPRYFIE